MTVVRFTDRRMVDVIDADCEWRPCFQYGFDKGPFTPGVGYTRPDTPHRPVCLHRHLHGCPHAGSHLICSDCRAVLGVAMDADGERPAMPAACSECGGTDLYWLNDVLLEPRLCCEAPRVRHNPRAYTQRCTSCGTRLAGRRLELAREASA